MLIMQADNFENRKGRLKFIVPSAAGIALFLVPVPYGGQTMIVVGILVNYFQDLAEKILPFLMTVMIVFPVLIALLHKCRPIRVITKSPVVSKIFDTTIFWLAVRILGAVFAMLVFFDLGPEIICSDNTGRNILFSLLPTCGMWFFVAGLLLPLITDYGIMDLMSTVFKKIARPLFRVPGRALIDCFSSWIGSGVCGAFLTISQYETGCYTAREAAVIITNFSV